jgi:hypothetical protein
MRYCMCCDQNHTSWDCPTCKSDEDQTIECRWYDCPSCGKVNEGWYCPNCGPNSVGKQLKTVNIDKAMETNVYAREVWNAAIEAAAKVAEINSAADIRKLKK